MAQYLVKRRSVEAARPNMYGHKTRHGRWETVSRHDAGDVAVEAARKVQGLYEVAVFFGGKRVTDSWFRLKGGAMLNAVLSTTAVIVACPACGEPQPAPDNGSDQWQPWQVREQQGTKTCVACDAQFRLVSFQKVQVANA